MTTSGKPITQTSTTAHNPILLKMKSNERPGESKVNSAAKLVKEWISSAGVSATWPPAYSTEPFISPATFTTV